MNLVIGGSYQGKTEYALNTFPKARFFNQAHLFIKKRLSEEKTQEEILAEILETTSEGQWVIIADEIGNGVVPMDANERNWRDIAGQILIELAKEAAEVHRVVLGIGQRIK
ncbi:MAG: bifunctional adenosylcobinamide kinase/adenosylcobinamide-phosphate guanylyltransferase [Pseudobutyrivibrio sp.]|uniref:bifunctional adenosylcobinamide kinase/adenosylcobinamide-phosphate guanylyltransferase n=1 Tax=Pseudobutyrivibrio sp. TaxID=2014367 RepID=UPI0025FDEE11|nr:bifunctional adenosylcobinamide kinase/adenosylcobinamide-phosphate guanylyltransferase [Pseudobutyrivibrio sp.]MBQ6461824.1 bifunctional adenosylcobinamide kinase/adenosylcobinamide-phosphate guanylyltransferase [Pseudobutyrivibrio sp.]